MPRKPSFKIAGERIPLGQSKDVRLVISETYTGEKVHVPLRVIRAKKPGPTVFITAAIHGDEVNGTGIIHDFLFGDLIELKSGTLILAPVVNVFGFESHERYLPDRRDLNRSFPGSAKGSLAAYLELHIEQGGSLEIEKKTIGVVEGIVGIRRYDVVFHGYANHAGTTPMQGRKDALVLAAPFILAVLEIAKAHEIVGTIGIATVFPGAPNVIPGRVELSLEIRGLHDSILDQAEAELAQFAAKQGGELKQVSNKEPTTSDLRLVDALIAACDELNLSYKRMPSGAGHDAMCMASIASQAMLFVPSHNGVSHSPDEYTTPEDCVNGARVLLDALLRLDETLDAEE